MGSNPVRKTLPLTSLEDTMKKFINVSVRIPSNNIVISEDHDDIEKAMDRGELLARNFGGNWSLTFNANQVKI